MKKQLKDLQLAMKESRENELKDSVTESLESSRHKHSSRRSKHGESDSHRRPRSHKRQRSSHTRNQNLQRKLTDLISVMKISAHRIVFQN